MKTGSKGEQGKRAEGDVEMLKNDENGVEGSPRRWAPEISNAPLPAGTSAHQELADGGFRGQVLRCFTCGHSVHHHYAVEAGLSGCVASAAPERTVSDAARFLPGKPFFGDSGCLCPGWLRGEIPAELADYFTAFTNEDTEDLPCVSCTHPLGHHRVEQGCLSCPCEVHSL